MTSSEPKRRSIRSCGRWATSPIRFGQGYSCWVLRDAGAALQAYGIVMLRSMRRICST
jgi:hypothetical protein